MSRLKKFAQEIVAESKKEEVEEVSAKSMPSASKPKEQMNVAGSGIQSTFDRKSATREESAILDKGFMVKQLRAKTGEGISKDDISELVKEARIKAPTLVADLEDLLIATETLSGDLQREVWETTTASQLFNMREIFDLSEVKTLEDTKMQFQVIGEGVDGVDTDSGYLVERFFVNKIMGVTRASYEAGQRSLVNIATENLNDLKLGAGWALEKYILNGDNTATHMDADIEAGIAGLPEKFVKGIRKIASEKADITFSAFGTTDIEVAKAILAMQEEGGKYLDDNQVGMGNVVLMVTQKFYNRIRVMDGFSDASKSGMGSTLASGARVSSIFGIPVVVATYMPSAVNASGYVDAVAGNNTKTHCMMVNTKQFDAYYYGSPISEMDRNIVNQTNIWTLSNQIGFNGKYDRADSVGTVDATRKYAVRGIDIAV